MHQACWLLLSNPKIPFCRWPPDIPLEMSCAGPQEFPDSFEYDTFILVPL